MADHPTPRPPSDPSAARGNVRIPRITVHAFCDGADVAESIGAAARDRQMAKAQLSVRPGGIAAAIAHFREKPSPNLIVIETRLPGNELLAELDRLAEVCDPGTKLMVIGHANDIAFYRELMSRGVSEYMLAPVAPLSFVSAIASIYGEPGKGKLGQVLAFVGAKGGAGSSTIAHNVGWTIANRLLANVIIADMDLPFGTASLDFDKDASQGIADAIQDSARLDDVLLDRLLTRCGDHLSLLSAPAVLERPFDFQEGAFETLIEVAQASVPFLVLDVPHVWSSWTRKTLVAADEIVITAEPDLAGLRNARNLFGVLRQARPNDPAPRLVLNRVGMPKREEIKPSDFAKSVGAEPIACIPYDAGLFVSAANKGAMVAEGTPKGPARAFRDIAESVTGRQQSKAGRNGGSPLGALFARMVPKPKDSRAKGA